MVECFVVEGGELKKIEMEVMGEFKVIVEKMVEVIKKFDINFDEIYEIVMQVELVSEKFYKEFVKYVSNEKIKFFFEMFVDMERNYYNIFKKQYDYIMCYLEFYKEEFYDQFMKDINFNF